MIHRTQEVQKKWKLRVRFSPTKENRVASNEDFDEDRPKRFLACGVSVKIRTKNSGTESLVCCVSVLFSMAKSMLRMGGFALCATNVPLCQCSRVSLL